MPIFSVWIPFSFLCVYVCYRFLFCGYHKVFVNHIALDTKQFSLFFYIQFSSVAQWCLTLCDPMDCTRQASLSITNSQSLFKLVSIESVMPSNHLILCRHLLVPPSVFPSIRVFSS